MPIPAINLARGRNDTFVDKFTFWALTAGRTIIIFTETIALAAFLYRFSLDRRILNLHDSITQEQSILEVLGKDENKYRQTQNILNSIAMFNNQANINTDILKGIYAFATNNTQIQNFALSAGSVTIQISCDSSNNLYNFINQLKSYPPISGVTIDKIESKPTSGVILAVLTIALKQNYGQN